MMLADYERKLIHDFFVSILRGISKGAGYNCDVGNVYKSFIDRAKAKINDLAILAGQEIPEWADSSETEHKTITYFEVVGYVGSDSDPNGEGKLTDAFDSLSEDVQNALRTSVGTDGWNELESKTAIKDLLVKDILPVLDYESNAGVFSLVFVVTRYHGQTV